VLSFTQSVFVPTDVVVAGVELVSDDVDGDDVQAANVVALRAATANHNRRDLRACTVQSLAVHRCPPPSPRMTDAPCVAVSPRIG
jgi:hypothetical protein